MLLCTAGPVAALDGCGSFADKRTPATNGYDTLCEPCDAPDAARRVQGENMRTSVSGCATTTLLAASVADKTASRHRLALRACGTCTVRVDTGQRSRTSARGGEEEALSATDPQVTRRLVRREAAATALHRGNVRGVKRGMQGQTGMTTWSAAACVRRRQRSSQIRSHLTTT